MYVLRGLHPSDRRPNRCVATIGNFDGVHRGHQAIVAQVVAGARALGVPAIVIVFEPQPREYFSGAAAPPRLSRLRDKARALAALGIDGLCCLRFDAALAALSADDFIDVILVRGLGICRLVVGDDFRFGRGRTGTAESLRVAGARYGYAIESATTCNLDGARVSSTRVREALADHDFTAALRLLGRRYEMSAQLRRDTGIESAPGLFYLDPRRTRLPLEGTFAVKVTDPQGGSIRAVAATLDAHHDCGPLLAVHGLDGDAQIRGRNVVIEFIATVRDDDRQRAVGAGGPGPAAITAGRKIFQDPTISGAVVESFLSVAR